MHNVSKIKLGRSFSKCSPALTSRPQCGVVIQDSKKGGLGWHLHRSPMTMWSPRSDSLFPSPADSLAHKCQECRWASHKLPKSGPNRSHACAETSPLPSYQIQPGIETQLPNDHHDRNQMCPSPKSN